MPPKQVYGRRTATKTTASFTKFISPGKDSTVAAGRKKNVRATRNDQVEELEKEMGDLKLMEPNEAVENRKEKRTRRARRVVSDDDDEEGEEMPEVEPPANVDVVDLTNHLDALNLEKEESKQKQQGLKKMGKYKKGSKRVEGPSKVDNLQDEIDAPELRRDGSKPRNEELRKTKKSQKVLDKAVGTTTEAQPALRIAEQTTISEKHAKKQTPPSSPILGRRLKAVVIPRRTASPNMSLLPTPDPTPEPEDIYSAYASPLLSLSYEKKVVSFDAWSSALEPHFTVTKIAEASYSEVYRLTATSTTTGSANESVLKLVALKTPPNAPLLCQSQTRQVRDPEKQAKKEREAREEQDQWKSHVDDVHSEVKLLQNLNDIPGFTHFRELTVLQGRPSASFIGAWKAWNKTRPRGKKSEFPDPGKKTSYDDLQLWAVVEMHDAGTDCEKVMEAGGMSTIWDVWDVFWGVCLSVAKAEETCKFEHRDLHLENICIRSSRSRSDDDLLKPFIKDPLRRKLGFTGLDTTVIDYTLSRADVLPSSLTSITPPPSPSPQASSASASRPCTPTPTPEVAYLDLEKDMTLFAGDASEEYQYEMYRYMRGVVLHNDPFHTSTSPPSEPDTQDTLRRSPRKTPQHIRFDSSSDTETPTRSSPRKHAQKPSHPPPPPQDPWRAFHPKTNLIWTHFILHQLLAHLHDVDPDHLSSKHIMRNVDAETEDTERVVKKARKLAKVLERVAALLEPGVLKGDEGLESVKELVVLAMERGWLRVGDVAGL